MKLALFILNINGKFESAKGGRKRNDKKYDGERGFESEVLDCKAAANYPDGRRNGSIKYCYR